jgi:hypothetical protein
VDVSPGLFRVKQEGGGGNGKHGEIIRVFKKTRYYKLTYMREKKLQKKYY